MLIPNAVLFSVWFVCAAVGLGVCWFALLRDREFGLPRCPNCWYLMVGATGLRCPECGHVVVDSRGFYRRRRRWRTAAIGAALVLLPSGLVAYRFPDPILRAFLPKWRLIENVPMGAYTVRLYEDRFDKWPMQVRVLLNGEQVYSSTAWLIEIGGHRPDANRTDTNRPDANHPTIINQDLTGDGTPDLVIYEYSGGAHCCWTADVFSLVGDGLKPIATIEGQDSDVVFEDIDQDGVYEARLYDMTYRYWPGSFAFSPMPEVILTYRDGRYVVSDLMLRPRPNPAMIEAEGEAVYEDSTWSTGEAPPEYLWVFFDLLYSGNEREAWDFAEAAWPAKVAGYAEFVAELKEMLERSPYWAEIRERPAAADPPPFPRSHLPTFPRPHAP
jgi:hypothetical protein